VVCLSPPSGEAAGREVAPQEAKEGVAGCLSDPFVVPTDSFRKVGARPVLTTEEDPAGDGVVAEAEGSHVEHGDIHRKVECLAQVLGKVHLVMERGSPREAAIIQVDSHVDVPEFTPVDEGPVEIGKENLLPKCQKVLQGRGDASRLPRG
jgi:hypothetical protein